MLVNEVLQWSVLLFVVVVVLGLARQLGTFILPHEQQLAAMGPSLGDRLDEKFVSAEDQAQLMQLLRDRDAEFALVLVLADRCQGCDSIVQQLTFAKGHSVPILAIGKACQPNFIARLARVADVVVNDVDGKRAAAGGVVATPYGIQLGANARVLAVGAAAGVYDLLERAAPRSMTNPTGRAIDLPDAAVMNGGAHVN
jgi:hypothetical protein